jgi:hypothetical protein
MYPLTLTLATAAAVDMAQAPALVQTALTDPTATVQQLYPGTYVVCTAAPWTPPMAIAVRAALTSAPVLTPDLAAQYRVDALPIEYRALALAIIDALNIIRAALPVPLPPITPAQAIAAIRAKAASL